MASEADGLIARAEQVVQQVAELPDRTSPDDWPEAMLVTADELKQIVCDQFRDLEAADTHREALQQEIAQQQDELLRYYDAHNADIAHREALAKLVDEMRNRNRFASQVSLPIDEWADTLARLAGGRT